MGRQVTPRKPLEDLLAEYTEDLMADRRPRLSEDVGGLDQDERTQLMTMLALVRRLKAAHQEVPPPREAFLQRLDTFVREEIARQVAPESQAARTRAGSPGDVRAGAADLPLHRRILRAGRDLLRGMAVSEVGGRWRFAAAAVVVLLLGLQVLLYVQVRRLEQQNQALVARLERLSPSTSVVPLGLPRGERTIAGTETPKSEAPSFDGLFASVELRVRIKQRIGELEKEVETKTGRDRQSAEVLLREFRALLRPPPKP